MRAVFVLVALTLGAVIGAPTSSNDEAVVPDDLTAVSGGAKYQQLEDEMIALNQKLKILLHKQVQLTETVNNNTILLSKLTAYYESIITTTSMPTVVKATTTTSEPVKPTAQQETTTIEQLEVVEESSGENYLNAVDIIDNVHEGTHQNNEIQVIETSSCDEGFMRFHDSCYLLVNDNLNWTMANHYCADQFAHLVIINCAEENNFITDLANRDAKGLWIGAQGDSQGWKWVNNATEVTFTNWATDEPTGVTEALCAHICPELEYKWNAGPCAITGKFVCEREL